MAGRFCDLLVFAMAGPQLAVEHIVYFQVKPDASPDCIQSMASRLMALKSLPGVLHLAVGPVAHAPVPSPTTTTTTTPITLFPWTHALYGRYTSKDALHQYSVSPEHVAVVADFVRPIINDIAAVDWEVDEAVAPPPHSLYQTAMVQWKDGLSQEAMAAVAASLKEAARDVAGVLSITVGENFSPARAKSFTWGFAAFFADEAARSSFWQHVGLKALMEASEKVDCVEQAVLRNQ